MKEKIVAELAAFLEAHEYQVELWDRALVEYFSRNTQKFDQFLRGSPQTKCLVWQEGVRVAKCRGHSIARQM